MSLLLFNVIIIEVFCNFFSLLLVAELVEASLSGTFFTYHGLHCVPSMENNRTLICNELLLSVAEPVEATSWETIKTLGITGISTGSMSLGISTFQQTQRPYIQWLSLLMSACRESLFYVSWTPLRSIHGKQ